jgi:hypothetical protein
MRAAVHPLFGDEVPGTTLQKQALNVPIEVWHRNDEQNALESE